MSSLLSAQLGFGDPRAGRYSEPAEKVEESLKKPANRARNERIFISPGRGYLG
jgi:hypothetical protein